MPRFSVIVTADARADLVHRTTSVLVQTYRDLEVLVVEGCSGEPSWGSLAPVRDRRFKLIRQDGSQTSPHTTGARHSAGGRIAFLDDGDIASPGWLEMLAALGGEGDSRITRCGGVRLGPRGVVRDVVFPGPSEALEPWIRGFLPGSYDVPQALFEEAGGFGAQMYRWAKSYVRLYKEYRSAGLRRRPIGLVFRSWGWVILHLPDLLRVRPNDTGGYGSPPGTPAVCGEVSAIVSCSCEVLVKPEGL
jgi:glycosyltransferase involved in cell wall biosynthesis